MRILIMALFVLPSVCLSQEGGVLVRIPDGAVTRCINPAKDRVWITLRRLVTSRNKSWFTKDNSVGVIVKARVNTQPPADKAIEFPLMSEASFGDSRFGQVSLPIEYNIVSGLRLSMANEAYYAGIGMDITLLNKRNRSRWGVALSALNEMSAKLPIPATPATQAASYLMSFANTAVDKDLANQPNDDKVKSATLAINFDPTGMCTGDFESTGTIAVVQSQGDPTNLIPVSRVNDYCWSAELAPAFIVKAAKKVDGRACNSAQYAQQYQQISNNYVGFFVNAVGATGTSGPANAAAARDRQAALARCRANGITAPRACGVN